MNRLGLIISLIVLAASLIVLLTACGGGDDEDRACDWVPPVTGAAGVVTPGHCR